MRYPSALATKAMEMPVVPAVYSTTVPPGGRRPLAAARSTIVRARRSFMLPVGLAYSSLATTRALPAGTTRRSSTSGVFPIALRIPRSIALHPAPRRHNGAGVPSRKRPARPNSA